MLLTHPKTFVILKTPYDINGVRYVIMDLDGCHFTHREYRKFCNSPFATFITEDLYMYNMAMVVGENHEQVYSNEYDGHGYPMYQPTYGEGEGEGETKTQSY